VTGHHAPGRERGTGTSSLLKGLGVGLPVAVAIVVVGVLVVHNRGHAAPDAASAAPTVTVTATPEATLPAPTPTESASNPSPSPTKTPQGVVVVADFHAGAATNTCVSVQTLYENRSDTAVNTVTQSFVTTYTPKHKAGTYPSDVNGPTKTLTTTAGIAPFQSRWVVWQVCAPELAALQNPPPADGTDAFMSEIGALPKSLTWTWFN
jgi:hypothetical protein